MKLAILTYQSHQSNLMTRRLLTEFLGQVVGIMDSQVIIPGKTTLQSAWFLLKKTGLGFVVPKGAEIILSRLAPLGLKLAGRQPSTPALAQLSREYGVPLYGTKNVNAPDSLAILQRWQPDLVVSVYLNQLIKPALIALPPLGVINIHPALLPQNRGLFPYFWALANGDTETGVTVHRVDARFDTGDIIIQQAIPIQPNDSVLSLARKSAEVGAEVLVQAVKAIQSGNPPRVPQDSALASYYSWPTPEAVRRLKQRGRRYGSISEIWKELL